MGVSGGPIIGGVPHCRAASECADIGFIR